jgi:hypothetical protein
LSVDPVSNSVYDVNKDGVIGNVGDALSMAKNTCAAKSNTGGCPLCPDEN